MSESIKEKRELIRLQKEWYKKLQDEGFVDIERFDKRGNPSDILKFNFNIKGRDLEAEEEYYSICRAYLHTFKFKNKKEYEIWRLHSEGFSYNKICKTLKKLSYWNVFATVNEIKDYMLRDLNGTEKTTRYARRTRKRREIRGFQAIKNQRRKVSIAN